MDVLVVVDMQKDFISGALGTKEAVAIVPRVAKKIAQAKKAGKTVVFTRDTHHENYLQTQEGKNLPVPHCIENTPGWEIDPALDTPPARGFLTSPRSAPKNSCSISRDWTISPRQNLSGSARISA